MSPFKAYDIRGVFGRDFDADTVFRIGRVLPSLLDGGTILVGRDARVSSPTLRDALCRGLLEAGADVEDLGLATTPMVYHYTGAGDYAGSVMITASHNPPEYNGLKLSRRGALPIGADTGLRDLERRIADALPPPASRPGTLREIDRRPAYRDFLRDRLPDLTGLRLGIDASNGMAALLVREVFGEAPLYLHETLDGTFPNHSPNPLDPLAVVDLRNLVLDRRLDAGVIFDGDADRVMFLDEKGRFIRPDLLIALLAEHYLAREPGAGILYDIRTSRGVTEAILRLGGVPHMGRVGHAFAKVHMRQIDAVVGGELAGHYYFREFHYCDAAILCAEIVLGVLARARRAGRAFSDLVAEIAVYANTGERNYRVARKTDAMEALRRWALQGPPPSAQHDFDGYRFEWPDWWFNVRLSNTEPFLRLLCEARDDTLLQTRFGQIEAVLAPFLEAPAPVGGGVRRSSRHVDLDQPVDREKSLLPAGPP